MNTVGYLGRTLRLVRGGEVIAAVRAKTVTHTAESIDVTDGERDGWRRLLDEHDVISVTIEVEGVATSENYKWMLEEWYGSSFTDIVIIHPNGTLAIAEDGAWLQTLEKLGEHNGAVTFTASFTLSGLVTLLSEILLTSWPYSYISEDAFQPVPSIVHGAFMPISDDEFGVGPSLIGGALVEPLVEFDWSSDAFDIGPALVAGELGNPVVYVEYLWPLGEVFELTPVLIGGDLISPLVVYTNWPVEAFNVNPSLIGGSLT